VDGQNVKECFPRSPLTPTTLRGFDLFVSEPERDHRGVDLGVQ
jgi:hypothetical protein